MTLPGVHFCNPGSLYITHSANNLHLCLLDNVRRLHTFAEHDNQEEYKADKKSTGQSVTVDTEIETNK